MHAPGRVGSIFVQKNNGENSASRESGQVIFRQAQAIPIETNGYRGEIFSAQDTLPVRIAAIVRSTKLVCGRVRKDSNQWRNG